MKHKATYCLLATFSISILVWSIYFLAYYPGILSYDFAPQIIQYIQGEITTHHPVLHTLLVGSMWKLGYVGLGNANIGIVLYCILQMLVLALVYLRGAYLLLKRGAGMGKYICYSAFVALFPLNGFMACTVTKDVLFSAFVMLLVMTMLEIYFCHSEKIPKTTWILLGIGIAGTCIFRNNGKYALLGLLVAILWLVLRDKSNLKKHLRIWLFSLVIFVATLLAIKVVEVAKDCESGSPREMLSVPIQQMARVAVNNHETMDEELLQYIESCIGTDYVEKYRAEIADPIKDTFDVHAALDKPTTFIKNYFKMLVKYPKDCIQAFVELNAGYLFFWDETCAWINGDMGYIQTEVNEVFLESIGITIEPKLPKLHTYLQNWTTKNLYLNSIILRVLLAPAWYVYFAVGYFIYALFKKNKKHLPIAFFVAAYYVTLFLGPGVMVRYIYPMMISEFFVLLWCILTKTLKSKEVCNMAVLGCTVCNCVYNEDKRCCKGDIMVGGRKASSEEETCCDSFVDRKNDSASNSTQKPHDRISIDCEAENCKYNHNLRCVAEHVDIKGNGAKSSSGTLCATFTEASKSN